MMPSVPELVLPPPPARVHFVGVGGAGMSGLARILLAWRYRVSGSDANPSALLTMLGAEGVAIAVGHTDLARAAAADLVVITAAVRPDNPEVAAAEAAGVRVVKRAQLLGLLADARVCVAVAGSHGKSTTSGMLVAALTTLNAAPSYAVGATIGATGTNAAPGDGPAMVVEADEYDYSFLWLHSDIAIVTNIEYDHPDLFPDQDAYDAAFSHFVANVRPGGTLIIAADDPGCARLISTRGKERDSVVTFGESDGADWRLLGTDASLVVRSLHGDDVSLGMQVPGRHNARNAVAALLALIQLGLPPLSRQRRWLRSPGSGAGLKPKARSTELLS